MSLDHDVLIVGAGPAGAHLAIRLARAGWEVGLVEARRFPRPKPCGEFLSPACLPFLDVLGLLEETRAAGAIELGGMRLHGHGHVAEGTYRAVGRAEVPFGHGLALRREVLDAIALDAAVAEPRVTLHAPLRVGHILRSTSGAVIGLHARDASGGECELRARFTIGADGRQSIVARELGLRSFGRAPARFALVARYSGVDPGPTGELHLTRGGYFAAAPVDSGLFTLNLVVDRRELSSATEGARGHGSLETFLARRIEETSSLAPRLAHAERSGPLHVAGPLETRVRRSTFDGGALVGDAAGFVDPMTGEGIFLAMHGAAHLAASLDTALRASRTDARSLLSYERSRRRDITPRHRAARLLQSGLGRPRVERFLLSLLERHPALTDLVVGITGDYASPLALFSPRTWRQALGRQG
ncbi:MAG TPA: NAD(P)/FAD-dependent oxidoreductase [Planctomycetes bacterium]|nr:NAD(P)/FAD-dependent oxidoreductase [Planctomycetota bacterium]